MDREPLAAALRVLRSSYSGSRASESDLALVRRHALPSDGSLDTTDFASAVIWRIVQALPPEPIRVSTRRKGGVVFMAKRPTGYCCGPLAQKSLHLLQVLATIRELHDQPNNRALRNAISEQQRIESWIAHHSHAGSRAATSDGRSPT